MKNLFKKKKKYTVVAPSLEVIQNPEDEDVLYLEFPDGLRLVFREGNYVGWYTTNLAEPLN